MTDSSGTPSDAERNLRMALSIGVMDPRLRAACEAVLTALAASQSELKAAKARMWENGHALETATGRIESLEQALRAQGEDAARWRWIMGMGSVRVVQYDNFDNMKYLCQNDIDEYIDAAREAAHKGEV